MEHQLTTDVFCIFKKRAYCLLPVWFEFAQASFRHVVWPEIDSPEVADRIWGAEVHPDWQVQQLLADVAVYYLQKSYARFLNVSKLVE